MLKRLFLVIFILQSFALNAWAGMNMSQANQAEQTQMKIMHQTLDMGHMQQLKTQSPPSGSDSNISTDTQEIAIMDCLDCNQNMHCQDLFCSSIHATISFYTDTQAVQVSTLTVSNLVTPLSISIQYSNSQPETPPPAV
ncbi:MAG: hypothetical protein ISEC1_P1040 [Thiomicrorhabdus sp.]|nr:MAG: hypothetical protein ISEC1_P1040 [Thiomicrorhabdus sp.]